MGDFRIGESVVNPQLNLIQRGSIDLEIEPEVMAVLVYLARHAGQLVTRDQISAAVWTGGTVPGYYLTGAIADLRKAIGDNPRRPRIIQERGDGYSLILPVSPPEALPPVRFRWLWIALLIVPGVLAILLATFWYWPQP